MLSGAKLNVVGNFYPVLNLQKICSCETFFFIQKESEGIKGCIAVIYIADTDNKSTK